MKKIAFILFILTFSKGVFAQTKEQKIKETLDLFFEGIHKADTLKAKATIAENCVFRTIASQKDSTFKIIDIPLNSFYKAIGVKHPDLDFKEVLHEYSIKIDGPMVMVWTPYTFYINNKFSHCGVNLFTLIENNNDYKIISIIDTRRKENCPAN